MYFDSFYKPKFKVNDAIVILEYFDEYFSTTAEKEALLRHGLYRVVGVDLEAGQYTIQSYFRQTKPLNITVNIMRCDNNFEKFDLSLDEFGVLYL